MTPRALILLSVTALLCACGGQKSPIEVANAWSPAAPPTASTLAVYADITAHEADTLLGISAPVATMAQLHATSEEGGMMRMREVPQLVLARNETVHLAPGGMHLMLMDVSAVPQAGDHIALVLHFAKAGDVNVDAQVRAAN
ncbi:MAG TPA: copper chaperone PCu(A)C [Povalibacter sp.]|nr:copper chaperone PCu(A)C [Povalibacter sp.]